MRKWWLAMAGVALAGCAHHAPAPPAPPTAGETITLETGPCFGSCPVYRVTVRADGTGVFEGKRFTAATGEHPFTVTPTQYAALAARLAPYRPAGAERRLAPGEPGCEHAATDMPSMDVRWTRADGTRQQLHYYFGCDLEGSRAMRDAVGNAASLLPLDALIGPRP